MLSAIGTPLPEVGGPRRRLVTRLLPLLVIAGLGVLGYVLWPRQATPRQLPPSPPPSPQSSPTSSGVEPFIFSVSSVTPIAELPGEATSLSDPAGTAADLVSATLSDFYEAAFLDPRNWRSASYEPAWTAFAPQAVEAGRLSVDTLTAGSDAAGRFVDIRSVSGHLAVEVLIDADNQATLAVATVHFTAEARASDGSVTRLGSVGRFTLAPSDSGWKIISFRVDRTETPDKTLGSSPSTAPG